MSVQLIYPLKTSEQQRFSKVFRKYEDGTMTWDGLKFKQKTLSDLRIEVSGKILGFSHTSNYTGMKHIFVIFSRILSFFRAKWDVSGTPGIISVKFNETEHQLFKLTPLGINHKAILNFFTSHTISPGKSSSLWDICVRLQHCDKTKQQGFLCSGSLIKQRLPARTGNPF